MLVQTEKLERAEALLLDIDTRVYPQIEVLLAQINTVVAQPWWRNMLTPWRLWSATRVLMRCEDLIAERDQMLNEIDDIYSEYDREWRSSFREM